MTFSVYQHWDPLKVCIVGRSYPPEFYSWITKKHVRKLFERIAIETEEDYQKIIKKLKSFSVEILRPDLPLENLTNGQYQIPPMAPRDYTVMIGNTFYQNYNARLTIKDLDKNIAKDNWYEFYPKSELENLPILLKNSSLPIRKKIFQELSRHNCYDKIYDYIESKGNKIVSFESWKINGAMVSRIGKDLYFGTPPLLNTNNDYKKIYKEQLDKIFPTTRNHIVNTQGHSDAVYCPVAPGLIISLKDVPTYKESFPNWEVIYLPEQSWNNVEPFLKLKEKNAGKWWIPGFEQDQDVINLVETWLKDWVGYVEETVFDVNMLIIDPKNVLVFNFNKTVFDALERFGITPHIINFRHRFFWDGGIHCLTSDLDREGHLQNYFPERD